METADTCRRAALDAVADVEPPRLLAIVERVLDGASMVPGALTLESAAAADGGGVDPDEQALTHAAGVQLIYEGLRLTRRLAQTEPWTEATGDTEADLEILAADILVARGFYLLARTAAADRAVQTVQSFGRDQTERAEMADVSGADRAAIDANLERDVLALAVEAGGAAIDEPPAARVQTLADEIGRELGPGFPPLETYRDRLRTVGGEPPLEKPATDRATSATDS